MYKNIQKNKIYNKMLFNYIRNFFVNLGKNELYLGRWNYKNTEKYMDWANYDNCFKTSLIFSKKFIIYK